MNRGIRKRSVLARTLICGAVTAAVSAVAIPGAGASAPSTATSQAAKLTIAASDWPAYLRGPGHTSGAFSVPAITQAHVPALTPSWTWNAPGGPMLSASPTVAAGRVFIGANNGGFYALNSTTGAVIWHKTLDRLSCCGKAGVGSTATVAPDPTTGLLTVYVAGGRYLYALDAATGAQRWKSLVGPAGSQTSNLYRNWSSPTVVGGHVVMGISSTGAPSVRGGVQTFDQHSGTPQNIWYAMAPGHLGASVWASVASDGTWVWVSTGDPNPTGATIDDAFSIVRLSLSTLTEVDKFTASIPINQDNDFGSSPTLFKATIGGTSQVMVGACNKNGNYYALKAMDLAAGPVWVKLVGQQSVEPNMCIDSAAWDFQRQVLFVAANQTTVAGHAAASSIREVDPATGAYLWETALAPVSPPAKACYPVGSPALNGSTNLLAVPLWCANGKGQVQFVNSLTGQKLRTISLPHGAFSQPVFADSKLYVGDGISSGGQIIAYK